MDRQNIQPISNPAKIRLAVAARRILGVNAENAVAIRVECQRAAMGQNVTPQSLKIGAGGLGRREPQRRQPARRIINKDDQGAAGAAALEPIMRAAVNLDQLAKARPALSQGEHPLGPPPLGAPQAKRDLELAHRLRRNRDPLQLQQLLARKGRAKSGVFISQKHTQSQTQIRR